MAFGFSGLSSFTRVLTPLFSPTIEAIAPTVSAATRGLQSLKGQFDTPSLPSAPQPPQQANPLRDAQAPLQLAQQQEERRRKALFSGLGGDTILTSPLGVLSNPSVNVRQLLGQ